MCPDLKYFLLANRLNNYNKEALVQCQAHFRASLNSISFISLRCDKPQLGFQCSYQELVNVEEVDIPKYCERLNEMEPPGRPTPEKKLQSYITRFARKNGAFPFDPSIQLFTDEFAATKEGKKLVVDLLGFNAKTGALVIIELKSARALTELKRQLHKAEELIRSEAACFQSLLKTSGFDWNEPFRIEKVAIWPPAQTSRPKLFPEDIREFTYRTEDDCYFDIRECREEVINDKMTSSLDQRYSQVYTPLLTEFLQRIEGVNLENLPEPFLPVYGEYYEKAKERILFMGWETRNSYQLKEFVALAEQDPEDALFWNREALDYYEYCDWRSNFGNDFWSFNLKFLAKFHGIEDWRDLYKKREQYGNILGSFAWANMDAIERYEVTARQKGAHQEDWQKIKDASSLFDRPALIFDTLDPHIVVLLHWHKEEDWLLEGLTVEDEGEPEKHLWYYKLKDSNRIIFWTYHPRGHNGKDIDPDELIDQIIGIYRRHQLQEV